MSQEVDEGSRIFCVAWDLPSRLGYEASGVLDALGQAVVEPQVGEQVGTIPSFSMRQFGVYGETAVVPADAAVRYPPNLSPVEGAAIWMQCLTPYFALRDHFPDGKFTEFCGE